MHGKPGYEPLLEMPSQLLVSLEFELKGNNLISFLDKASDSIPGQEMIDMVLELHSKDY